MVDELKDYQSFYFEGFKTLEISESVSEKMDSVCTSLFRTTDVDLEKQGFVWKSKYPNTEDLRPNVFDYDSVFLDFLFASNFHKTVNRLSQRELILSHIQIRKSHPGPSYMSWHRDSYMYTHLVGNAPSAHKIIYYPLLDREKEERLEIAVGSSVCGFSYNQNLDRQVLNILPKIKVDSSKTTALFFDTRAFHSVIPDISQEGSIRVIYSFVTEDQYRDYYADDPLHSASYKLYTERLY